MMGGKKDPKNGHEGKNERNKGGKGKVRIRQVGRESQEKET